MRSSIQEEVIRWDLNGTYTNDILAQGVKDSLENRVTSKSTFTFLSLQAVHSPLQAPEEYIEMYRHIKDKRRRNYNAMTTAMDDMIGDVVKTYKDLVRFRELKNITFVKINYMYLYYIILRTR